MDYHSYMQERVKLMTREFRGRGFSLLARCFSNMVKKSHLDSFLRSRVYVIVWYTNTYNIHIVTCKRGSGKGILKGEFWCWLVGCQIFVKTYLKRKVEHLTGSLFDSFQTLILNVDIANIHWRNRVRLMMGDFPGRGFPEGLVLVVVWAVALTSRDILAPGGG